MLVALLVWTQAAGAAGGVVQVTLLQDNRDVTKANLDAIAIFQRQGAGGTDREFIRCAVGAPCDLAPGAYLADVESQSLVVESRPYVTVDDEDIQRPFGLELRVTPSARIEVPSAGFPPGAYLCAIDGKTGTLHSRKVQGQTSHVRVPGRRVLLCAYDATGSPVACQILTPNVGETVKLTALAQAERGRGQLLIGLVYSATLPKWDATVTLRMADWSRPPDFLAQRYDHIYAAWLDAPVGKARVSIQSHFWTIKPDEIDVPEKRTGIRMKIPLVRKPSLRVALSGGEVLGPGPVQLDLFSCAGEFSFDSLPPLPRCVAAGEAAGPAAQAFFFESLEASTYALRWRKPPFEATVWIDMRDGRSREEKVPVELIEVAGRITRRGAAVEAAAAVHLEAYNTGSSYNTVTDPDGRYSLHVAQRGRHFLRVKTKDGAPFAATLIVGNAATYDVDIPGNRVRVRVVADDAPVVAARVSFEIRTPPPDATQKDVGSRPTDGEGQAVLPPLQNGLLRLDVTADGFRSAHLEPEAITSETGDRDLTVRMQRGAGPALHVLTPTGQTAGHAFVWSDNSGADADETGTAFLGTPLGVGAPLVAFDVAGHMGFFRYSGADEETLSIPPSGPSILVRFLTPDGKPLSAKNVYLAVDGVADERRFLNQALQSGGDPASRSDGTLRVVGLPASGELTMWPVGRADLAVTRRLPIAEEIVFSLPLAPR